MQDLKIELLPIYLLDKADNNDAIIKTTTTQEESSSGFWNFFNPFKCGKYN
jgi:hypothetical protein